MHSHALLGFADEAGAGTESDNTFPLHHKGHTGSERQGNEGTLSISDTGAFRSGDSEARGRVSYSCRFHEQGQLGAEVCSDKEGRI